MSPADTKPNATLLQKYPQLANLVPLKGTLRYRLALSMGGTALRIQLSNELGEGPMHLAASSVALADRDMDAVSDTMRRLTFEGRSSIDIPANATVVSDPIDLRVDAFSELVVSLYLPQGWPAAPLGAARIDWVEGDAVTRTHLDNPNQMMGRPPISGILVARDRLVPVIAGFGDSITDGARTKPAESHGWVAAFAHRLADRPGGPTFGVVSAGIGGNRLLNPGTGASALVRFDRDVLAVPGITDLIVLEGINDIGNSDAPVASRDASPVSVDALTAALGQLAARAHARGLRVFGGTLLPFRGAFYYSDDKEKIRLAVNTWIRQSSAFDGVIDFDDAMKDPSRPDALNPAFDSGDHLHPNNAGYQAMAAVVPLDWFR